MDRDTAASNQIVGTNTLELSNAETSPSFISRKVETITRKRVPSTDNEGRRNITPDLHVEPASMPYQPIYGPIETLMILHYVWYGALLLGSIGVGWTTTKSYNTVIIYLVPSFMMFQVGRAILSTKPTSPAHMFLSLFPYYIFHVISSESHVVMGVLWFVSIMFIHLQIGSSLSRKTLLIGCVSYIVMYGFGFISVNSSVGFISKLWPRESTSSAQGIGQGITCMVVLVVVSLILYRLHDFIQKYADFFLKQENHAEAMAKVHTELHNELKSLTNPQLDLDAPMIKVIQLLRNVYPNASSESKIKLEEVIAVLASNQIYQPNLEATKESMDGDVNTWLNGLVNYQYTNKNLKHDSVRSLAGSRSPSIMNIPEVEEYEIVANTWEFNIFDFNDSVKTRPLYHLSKHILEQYGVSQHFNLDETLLDTFLARVDSGYRNNLYHCSLHGADVLQSVHYFLTTAKIDELLTREEQFSCLIAAMCHDIDHPGVNNAFLINTGAPLAVRYNDISVLENHHCAKTFELMFTEQDCAILKNLSFDRKKQIRSTIVSCILATDMAQHFEYITKFKNKISGGGLDVQDQKDRQLIMDIMMKCSDISNPARESSISLKWTSLIMEEFFKQGDEERRRGIPISVFMDRNATNVPKCQLGFIDYIVQPLFEPWTKFLDQPDFKGLDNLNDNREYWKKKLDEDQQQPKRS